MMRFENMVVDSGLTIRQERALAITPKFGASLSIPCSIFIIYEVYTDHKNQGTNSVQRALVGMSIVDILASSAWFLSTWAVPKGEFALSAGNRATCNFQGFLLQLAVGAPLYNSSLALFYLLIIKKRWTDAQLTGIERWVHGFILTFTIGTSFLMLLLEQYNHIGAVCWVIGYPQECGTSSFHSSDIPCERGDHAYIWGVLLFYGPLWICVIGCFVSMVILYLEVRETHLRARRYSHAIEGMRHSMNRSANDSSKVATQAILYSLSFIITWMPSTMWSIAHWFNWSHYGLDMAAATAEPLQGFWNLLIFLRSRPKTVAKIKNLLSSLLPCCCRFEMTDYDFRSSFVTSLRGSRLSRTNMSTVGSELGDASGRNLADNSIGHPFSKSAIPAIQEESESELREQRCKSNSCKIDATTKDGSVKFTSSSNNDTANLHEQPCVECASNEPIDDKNSPEGTFYGQSDEGRAAQNGADVCVSLSSTSSKRHDNEK